MLYLLKHVYNFGMRNFIKFYPNILLHLCREDFLSKTFLNELMVEVLAVVITEVQIGVESGENYIL